MFGVINRIFLNFNFWLNLTFAGSTFPFAADCEKAVDKQPSNKANFPYFRRYSIVRQAAARERACFSFSIWALQRSIFTERTSVSEP